MKTNFYANIVVNMGKKKKTSSKSAGSGIVSKLKTFLPIGATLVTLWYVKPGGWASVGEAVRARNVPGAFQSALRTLTGVRLGGIGGQANTEWDPFTSLNPIDFNEAPAAKVGFVTRFSMEAMSKVQSIMSSLIRDVF